MVAVDEVDQFPELGVGRPDIDQDAVDGRLSHSPAHVVEPFGIGQKHFHEVSESAEVGDRRLDVFALDDVQFVGGHHAQKDGSAVGRHRHATVVSRPFDEHFFGGREIHPVGDVFFFHRSFHDGAVGVGLGLVFS